MMTEYNKLVDHLVSTMPSNSPPMNNKQERKSFDELYEEYSAMSIPEQLNNLKRLGRELVTTIDRLIDNLDDILEEEITVDPLTHKVTYNRETNEYNVVKK